MKERLLLASLLVFLLADTGHSFVSNQALRINLLQRPPKTIISPLSWRYNDSTVDKKSTLYTAAAEQNMDDKSSFMRRCWSDFGTGVSFVHNNYLDICCMLFPRVLAAEATLMIGISIMHVISPYLEAVAVSTLIRTLKSLSLVSNLYQIPCLLLLLLPIMAAFYGIFLLGILVPRLLTRLLLRTRHRYCLGLAVMIKWLLDRTTVPVYRSIIRWSEASQSAGFQTSFQDLFQRPVAQYSLLIVVGPVLEEILFRFLFDRFQGRVGRFFKSEKRTNDSLSEVNGLKEIPDQQRHWYQRYKPWVLISSVLFAASHFSNWYPTGSILLDGYFMGTSVDPSDVGRLISAVFQMTVALMMSLEVFTPIYMRVGLFSSIGAHMAWNCFSFFAFLNIGLRLVWKAIRSFHNNDHNKHNHIPKLEQLV